MVSRQPVVVSVGGISVDIQVRSESWPSPGEAVMARDFRLLGGGKAAHVAHFVRGMEHPALLVGCVGADALAEHALRALRESGVDLQHVSATPQGPTGVSLVLVKPDGEKVTFVANNANDSRAEHTALDARAAIEAVPEGSVVVVSLEVPAAVVGATVTTARERGLSVILDPAPVSRLPLELLRDLHCITPTASEASAITGMPIHDLPSARAVAQKLVDRGVRAAYLKMPGGDCVLCCPQGVFHVLLPSPAAPDSIAAGNAFAAALAVALVEKRRLVDAGRFAAAAASCAVSRYGALPGYPDRVALERQIARLEIHALTEHGH